MQASHKIFVSFSHADRKFFEELQPHLTALSERTGFEIWQDVQSESNSEENSEPLSVLETAQVAILLVSAKYLASNFIALYELPQLLKAAVMGNLRLLWVPVSASAYNVTPLAEIPAASDPLRPLDSLPASRRLQEWEKIAFRIAQALGLQSSAPASVLKRIALLYKRWAKPDEDLVDALHKGLTDEGFDVFMDRDITASVAWGRRVVEAIQTADAVIPILSEASVSSEMLAYEVNLAAEAAQAQSGKPRLLPVRVNYRAKILPDSLEILNPIQHFEWNSQEDTNRLLAEIAEVTRRPVELQRPAPILVSGPAPEGDELYIEREIDRQLRNAITGGKEFLILLKGARQMGRTSLLARGLRAAESSGFETIYTDFQRFNLSQLSSLESMYQSLAESLQPDLDSLEWKKNKTPNENLNRFFKRQVLGQQSKTVVWGMDEIDRLFAYSYASEFFGLIRSWHNERSVREDTLWERLVIVIAYATEPFLFIQDLNQSPFAIGLKLQVEDLTLHQVAQMNDKCGNPLKSSADVQAFYDLVGGHPALVRRGLYALRGSPMPFMRFREQAFKDDGPFGDHLRRVLVELTKNEDLFAAVQKVLLKGAGSVTSDQYFRLLRAGILKGDTPDSVQPRCALYGEYLRRHLLRLTKGQSVERSSQTQAAL